MTKLGPSPVVQAIDWILIQERIQQIYLSKGWVWPDGQDAATFTAQEAHEMIDLFLRTKAYVRNHEKPLDALWKESAQCFLMLCVTCMVSGEDLNENFVRLLEEYT